MDRRACLKSAGVTIALPLLESFGNDRPHSTGDDLTPIRRMVCVANGYGMYPGAWFPTEAGRGYKTPRLLKPLEQFRDDFTVFSHLDHDVDGGHVGAAAFLSGVRPVDARAAGSDFRTLDLVAADHVGPRTHLPVLRLGRSWSYDARGALVPAFPTVGSAFEKLFVTPSRQSIERQRHRMINDKSILDAVLGQTRSLQNRLSHTDRNRMNEYLSAVRSVEKRIADSRLWLEKPRPNVELSYPLDVQDVVQRVPLIYELITLALQTDSTRVATFGFALDRPADLSLRYSYHEYSHHGTIPERVEGLLKIEEFQMQEIARFLKRLKSIEEPRGGTLLDNTLLLFGSGLGNGSSHSCRNLPVLLAGGGLRHGNHYSFQTASSQNAPLSNLLLTMLRRFGSPAKKFGTSTGEISEL